MDICDVWRSVSNACSAYAKDNDLKLRGYYSKNGYLGFSKTEPDYIDEDKYWWIMWKRLK